MRPRCGSSRGTERASAWWIVTGRAAKRWRRSCRPVGFDVRFVHADVSRPDEAEMSVHRTLEMLGRVDVLFNHAGIIIVKPFLDFTLEGLGGTYGQQRQERVL